MRQIYYSKKKILIEYRIQSTLDIINFLFFFKVIHIEQLNKALMYSLILFNCSKC